MWCPNCNEIFDDDVKGCPFCGNPLFELPKGDLNFSTGIGDKLAVWPKDHDGKPVEATFLATASSASFEDEMICVMLSAYDIPTLKNRPNNGDFGKIIFGAGAGIVDIFVPATMHDEATRLLERSEGSNEEL